MKTSDLRKRILYIAAAAIAALVCVLPLFPAGAVNRAYASANKFDDTNVLTDLNTSKADGVPFNILNYPYKSGEEPRVINFVEYCYSYKANLQGNYGLYLYVYNPGGVNIDVNSGQNKVELATKYNEEGAPSDYEKFDVKFCSKSTGNYFNLFYKFRIVDRKAADGKYIVERVNSLKRRYDVSGVELKTVGAQNATEYKIAYSYYFTGYAAGYGADMDAADTLECEPRELDTIELEPQPTFFRTESSSTGAWYQNQLSAVYFSVPNKILDKYGSKLQAVKAEWYKYRLDDFIITWDTYAYNELKPYLGKDISNTAGITRGFVADYFYHAGSGTGFASWIWNYPNTDIVLYEAGIERKLLPMMFLVDENDKAVNYKTILNEIYNYDKSYIKGKINAPGRDISADLFIDGRAGASYYYNLVNIDAGDTYDLLSYNTSHNTWDKILDYGFWATLTGKVPSGQNYYGVEPIVQVKSSQLLQTDAALSNDLLIYSGDIADFKSYFGKAAGENETVFLFRFDNEQSFSQSIDVVSYSGPVMGGYGHAIYPNKGYYTNQPVYLNFDIITLTFNKDGVYHVIPVVQSPIDITATATPPPTLGGRGCAAWSDKLLTILFLIALVLVLLIFYPVLKPFFALIGWLLKGVLNILLYPFKLLFGALFKSKRGKKDENGSK